MKTLTLNYYQDHGHGWVKIKLSLLQKFGIAEQISTYSYMRKDNAYLEEDCDLGIYLARVIKRDGQRPLFKDKHNKRNSPVRKLERCPYGDRFQANSQAASEFFRERYANTAV